MHIKQEGIKPVSGSNDLPDAKTEGDYNNNEFILADDYVDTLTTEDLRLLHEAEERALRNAPPITQTSSPQRTGNYAAYVVFCGRSTGVFRTWAATKAQVSGWPGGCQKGYNSLKEAQDAWVYSLANGTGRESGTLGPNINRSPARPYSPPKRSTTITPDAVAFDPSVVIEGLTQLSLNEGKSFTTSSPKTNSRADAPTPKNKRSPHREDVSFSTLDVWWVVYKGSKPGVYHSLRDALSASGTHPKRLLGKAASEDMANQEFVNASMSGLVECL
ncbi:hypothetical protein JR316_0009316 [Psilocybe cubensis]|uniref:Ribonuclease H1 N-terminal domain-containing protein n=2 Tax=Psilocybe cubensis TaxID=181762 RepID=A0A8H7XZE6_PSICU|nr:hypothetical protein JR316_0009316 [Psilocybe cubensis]KAH9478854.1 hypothetical protein JR316_0009316 [Psilocybe cubensis]